MESMIGAFEEKDMEYEAFLMNEMCHFTGGFCNSLHCDEMVHICQLPYRIAPVKEGSLPVKQQQESDIQECIGDTGCGLCALWALQRAGVSHLKIVGRGKSPEAMAADIKAVRKALSILEVSQTQEIFQKQMKKELFGTKCSLQCYY